MTEFVASNGVGVRYREDGSIEVSTLFGWALAMPAPASSAVLEFLRSENEGASNGDIPGTFPYPNFKPSPDHVYTSITHNPRRTNGNQESR